MQKEFSLYLDLIRFLMALVVTLGHSTFHGYTGHGFLWRLDPFNHMQTAVIGFFVLSGYVIAFAADKKEGTIQTYSASRISRLESVIIPALIITFIFDGMGRLINPGFYRTWDFPCPIGESQPFRYFLSAFTLNGTWLLPEMEPGTNGPFWSMTYEAAYYAAFGALFYLHGLKRIVVVGVIFAVAGVKVLILFPLWLSGALVYFLRRRFVLHPHIAIGLFALSIFIIGFISNLRPGLTFLITGRSTHLDYAEGIAFAVNIYAAGQLPKPAFLILTKFPSWIRRLGLVTFPLYLCHRPLLNFFATIPVGEPDTIVQKIWLFFGIFSVTLVVTVVSERIRPCIKNWILMAFAARKTTISEAA